MNSNSCHCNDERVKRKRVSFIVPCYNASNFLRDCVESIIAQDIDDKEIILVNDASTDGTCELIRNLSSEFTCVKHIDHEKNMGVEASRNDGLEIAEGDWIVFVDADDVLAERTLTHVVEGLNDEEIVFGEFEYFDRYTRHVANCGLNQGLYSVKEIAEGIGSDIPWDVISCIGNKLYNKMFLYRNGLRFSRDYKFNEDGAFALNSLRHANKVRYTDEIWYNYRFNPKGSMNSYKEDAFFSLDAVNDLLDEFFEENSCKDLKKNYLIQKRIGSIISSLNSEIENGTRNGFFRQVDRILSDDNYSKWICSVLKSEEYNCVERDYLGLLYKKNWSLLIDYAKKNSLLRNYKLWLNLKIEGHNVVDEITKKRIKHISIYGAGELGRLLAYEAGKQGILVDSFIDVNEKGKMNGGIPVLNPEYDQIPKTTEIIVNTVLIWNTEINNYINSKTDVKVVSIREFYT